MFIIFVAVTVWSLVSVWRCASNATIPFWFWVAQHFRRYEYCWMDRYN